MTDAMTDESEPQKHGFGLPMLVLLGLVVGVASGIACQSWMAESTLVFLSTKVAKPVGDIFLNMMFLTVIPLVFSSLSVGVAGLGDLKTVGKLGLRILGGTVVLSVASVLIGLLMANTLRPGEGIDPVARQKLIAQTQGADVDKGINLAKDAKSFTQVLSETVSRNPLEDAVNLFNPAPHYRGGGILSFLFVSVLVGVAITSLKAEQAEPLVKLLESVQSVCMVIIGYAMNLAPLGVAALVFQATSRIGFGVFGVLGKYVAAVVLGLLIHMVVTYSVALYLGARRNPMKFFRAIQEVIITAFSTSSSNATLPTSMRVAVENLHLPKPLSSFVLTVGATGNQNGTALFEGITVLFLAQFYGIDLSLSAQATVILMSVLAGVGTAGVPGGSIPLIVLVLQTIGVPAQGIGVVLGVDRFLDMCRTVVNVVGDLVLACVAAGPEHPEQEH